MSVVIFVVVFKYDERFQATASRIFLSHAVLCVCVQSVIRTYGKLQQTRFLFVRSAWGAHNNECISINQREEQTHLPTHNTPYAERWLRECVTYAPARRKMVYRECARIKIRASHGANDVRVDACIHTHTRTHTLGFLAAADLANKFQLCHTEI